jgi:hypothetical protein
MARHTYLVKIYNSRETFFSMRYMAFTAVKVCGLVSWVVTLQCYRWLEPLSKDAYLVIYLLGYLLVCLIYIYLLIMYLFIYLCSNFLK